MKFSAQLSSFVTIAIFILNCNCTQAGSKRYRSDKITLELETINEKIQRLLLNKDADSLVALYSAKFTFLPEFKSAITERNTLKKFYNDWFNSVNDMTYKKTIYKVEAFADYDLEIGNFSLTYSTAQNSKKDYTGKYMIMWKRNAKKELTILSEAFGSDKHIGPDDVPYATVEITGGYVLNKNIVSNELKPEIEEYDKILTKAVEDGNGNARADGFTQDGIYMPHYDPLLDGMDALRPYMMKTYTPGSKLFVKNNYREIFTSGEFVFIDGHFKGGWGDPVTGGKFEGNMSNLMKRDKNGKLLMYRQLANNDR